MLGLFAMNLLRPVPGLLIGILIASGLASAALPGATGDVYVVDATGGGDFLDIQSAVDAASRRDTILVRPGNYGGSISTTSRSPSWRMDPRPRA